MSTLSNDPASRYWREHFNCEPNPLQRRLLKNARRHLSLSDPFMFFFAFVIHVCTLAYHDDDIEFMTDAAVSRDLAKQMRTDYEALSRIIPLLERRLDQLEFLAERTSDQIRGWESHEERLSIWQIKPEELPTWSMILVNGMFLMILAGSLLLVAA